MKFKAFFMVAAATLTLAACTKDNGGTPDPGTPDTTVYGKFRLELDHQFGTSAFQFNTDYTTGNGDNINISMLKYYLTNVQLQKMDGSWLPVKGDYLVDASVPAATLLQIDSVPVAEYRGIRYMIGVDSVRNFSGAQEGVLAPGNGMFWSWNSGYIFLKLEGTSAQAANPVEFHIGGFTGANAAQANIEHDFGSSRLRVTTTGNPQTHVMVQVDQFFEGATSISLATLNMVHMPGANAKLISDNIATMFAFDHIHN